MNDLKICFHSFTEANEVTNDMLTLEACGIKGKKLVGCKLLKLCCVQFICSVVVISPA